MDCGRGRVVVKDVGRVGWEIQWRLFSWEGAIEQPSSLLVAWGGILLFTKKNKDGSLILHSILCNSSSTSRLGEKQMK